MPSAIDQQNHAPSRLASRLIRLVCISAASYVIAFQVAVLAIGFDSDEPRTPRGLLEWNDFLLRPGLERATAIQFVAVALVAVGVTATFAVRYISRRRRPIKDAGAGT